MEFVVIIFALTKSEETVSLFIIALQNENDAGVRAGVQSRLKDAQISHYRISDNMILLSHKGDAQDITELSGVDEDGIASGVVFALSGAYAGYARRTMLEWLKKNERR